MDVHELWGISDHESAHMVANKLRRISKRKPTHMDVHKLWRGT